MIRETSNVVGNLDEAPSPPLEDNSSSSVSKGTTMNFSVLTRKAALLRHQKESEAMHLSVGRA